MAARENIIAHARNPNRSEVSFNSWLLDKHNLVEKTAGAAVLAIEILEILKHVFHKTPEIPLTQVLNLVFLIFVYVQLRKEFKRQFTVDAHDKRVVNILKLWRYSPEHREAKIKGLVVRSNKLIGQLRNINYFIITTATLYLFFLLKLFIEGEQDKFHFFHLLFDLISYIGAFYLLRCFFVMYLPTLERGKDILNNRTNPYIWVGVALMVLDVCLTRYVHDPITGAATGVFIAEFVCGVVNAVVFVLLIARFENKTLDIPPYILTILYAYAVLQTCLPFVTNAGLIFGQEFSEAFSSVVFKLVLIGKVALAAVLFYVLSSRRIFYYFMALRNIYDDEEEERHWGEFRNLITELPHAAQTFEIAFNPCGNAVSAQIFPDLFAGVVGHGATPDDAKSDLLRKISALVPLQE